MMATETLTDLELFHKFIGKELERGHKKMKVQECLERFEACRRDVEKLQQMLQPAMEAAARGEGKEIDWEEMKSRVRNRLAEAGVTDAEGLDADSSCVIGVQRVSLDVEKSHGLTRISADERMTLPRRPPR